MIVCSCHAVSDREIRRLARAGARCARSIAEACGAGTCCGGCRITVAAILEEVEDSHARRRTVGLAISASPEAI